MPKMMRPGAFVKESILPTRDVHTSPPEGWEVYPFYGLPDPPICRNIAKVGVDDMINRLIVQADFEQRKVGVTISDYDAAYLTYDQRWIIQCNILWMIHGFLGRPMTQEIVQAIRNGAADVIRWLASVESKPGDFGQNDIG